MNRLATTSYAEQADTFFFSAEEFTAFAGATYSYFSVFSLGAIAFICKVFLSLSRLLYPTIIFLVDSLFLGFFSHFLYQAIIAFIVLLLQLL